MTPAEEPTMMLDVEGRQLEFLVDTGATRSTINKGQLPSLRPTARNVQILGVSGLPQALPISEEVRVTCGPLEAKHAFLMTTTAPTNLLGRDLLCRLGCQISCTEEGVFVDVAESKRDLVMTALSRPGPTVYWWRMDEGALATWTHIIDNVCLDNAVLRDWLQLHEISIKTLKDSPPHCTAYYDATGNDENYREKVKEKLGERTPLHLSRMWIGREGIGIEAVLTSSQRALTRYPEGAAAHVTLTTAKGWPPESVGWMVGRLREVPLQGYRSKKGRWTLKRLQNGEGFSIDFKTQRRDGTFEATELPPKGTYAMRAVLTDPGESDYLLAEVPDNLWPKSDGEVGRMRDAEPLVIAVQPGMRLPNVKQYKLRPEADVGIAPVIQSLVEQKIIVETNSPCNTPILPVKKPSKDKWRFVQDLREVNKVIQGIHPLVPNGETLMMSIPPDATYFTVIDLCSAFFSVPIAPESQYLFAFTHRGRQYTWTVLPQGFSDSPTLFSRALHRDLADVELKGGSVLLQYVDDLLICSPSKEACEMDSLALLKALAAKGHKVGRPKLQFVRQVVTYLGHAISHGKRELDAGRVTAIMELPRPRWQRQMLRFLGMTGYCRTWILDFALLAKPLYEATKSNAPDLLIWTDELRRCFDGLKQALVTAPSLGLPDYAKPFTLYTHAVGGFAQSVLTQTHGDKERPVAYFSKKLDPVEQGFPVCLQAVAAARYAVERTADIVMGHPVTLRVPHCVTSLLLQRSTQHLSNTRLMQYESALITAANITIERCTTLNPASLMPTPEEGEPHVCSDVVQLVSTVRSDLKDNPLEYPDCIYYVDGSARRAWDGSLLSGYAVCSDSETVESGRLPPTFYITVLVLRLPCYARLFHCW
uniref:uncharacterized protein n=1 Tax=Myxine glutinosa TaxID=7769 RepID=UPI00358E1EFB